MTEYRVGQRVRVEDVQEGIVTRVEPERQLIYIDGIARMTDGSPYGMTRTITVIEEPELAEPTGLGAVVRDAHGNTWSRSGVFQSAPWRKLGVCTYVAWSGTEAVEILFPGVES